MNISEFIGKLQEIQRESGNLEVVVSDKNLGVTTALLADELVIGTYGLGDEKRQVLDLRLDLYAFDWELL